MKGATHAEGEDANPRSRDRNSEPQPDGAARPFVKWAGGKTQLLPELLKRVPPTYWRYHEPFVGGGALFFALAPRDAFLGDLNERLVRTYRAIRRDVDQVIRHLRERYEPLHSEEFYYERRAAKVDTFDDEALAAWFIYMNKTGFNGLYRVNKAGGFNVPFGRYENPTICDEANLRACAAALATAQLYRRPFEHTLGQACEGDLVYFDPPYAPMSKTANFTSYTTEGFSFAAQQKLRDVVLRLKQSGVHVIVSNSSAEVVGKLYDSASFTIEEVKARRNINSKGSKRGAIAEYIIT